MHVDTSAKPGDLLSEGIRDLECTVRLLPRQRGRLMMTDDALAEGWRPGTGATDQHWIMA